MIAILGRFARNFILIWLCIAQPTVAIASEISWAGNIVSEDFQHHVDWRGHPEDLSSDIRVQSTYQISPDNEVAVQTSFWILRNIKSCFLRRLLDWQQAYMLTRPLYFVLKILLVVLI
jgi:hypothetical protein